MKNTSPACIRCFSINIMIFSLRDVPIRQIFTRSQKSDLHVVRESVVRASSVAWNLFNWWWNSICSRISRSLAWTVIAERFSRVIRSASLSSAARIFSANLFEIQIVFGVRRVCFSSVSVFSWKFIPAKMVICKLINYAFFHSNRHFYRRTLETTVIGRQNWFCFARNSRRKVS